MTHSRIREEKLRILSGIKLSTIEIESESTYSLFHILSVKTNYEEVPNLKRIEKKIEKILIKPIIRFDGKI